MAGKATETSYCGRYAPSPSGRMHLGNMFTALLSWLAARKAGGRWILRIEDLDPQRSRRSWAELIEDDLAWLGLDYDEGGLADRGPSGPYSQSMRHNIYAGALERLVAKGLVYGCRCTRADLRAATQAPHAADLAAGAYTGRCRPAGVPPYNMHVAAGEAARIYVDPLKTVEFVDAVLGPQRFVPARECGDFVLRRGDGAWSYQLAVAVDDALMGVTEVVRGNDLLSSAARQIYLLEQLGMKAPEYAHVPLVCNSEGVRLSKRDEAAGMDSLCKRYTPNQLTGLLAYMAGLQPTPDACSPASLIEAFAWGKLPKTPMVISPIG